MFSRRVACCVLHEFVLMLWDLPGAYQLPGKVELPVVGVVAAGAAAGAVDTAGAGAGAFAVAEKKNGRRNSWHTQVELRMKDVGQG